MNGTFPVLVRLIHSNNLLCPLMNLLIANSKSSLNGFRCCKSLLELELAVGTIFWVEMSKRAQWGTCHSLSSNHLDFWDSGYKKGRLFQRIQIFLQFH